jgi:hypothetical protein
MNSMDHKTFEEMTSAERHGDLVRRVQELSAERIVNIMYAIVRDENRKFREALTYIINDPDDPRQKALEIRQKIDQGLRSEIEYGGFGEHFGSVWDDAADMLKA